MSLAEAFLIFFLFNILLIESEGRPKATSKI